MTHQTTPPTPPQGDPATPYEVFDLPVLTAVLADLFGASAAAGVLAAYRDRVADCNRSAPPDRLLPLVLDAARDAATRAGMDLVAWLVRGHFPRAVAVTVSTADLLAVGNPTTQAWLRSVHDHDGRVHTGSALSDLDEVVLQRIERELTLVLPHSGHDSLGALRWYDTDPDDETRDLRTAPLPPPWDTPPAAQHGAHHLRS